MASSWSLLPHLLPHLKQAITRVCLSTQLAPASPRSLSTQLQNCTSPGQPQPDRPGLSAKRSASATRTAYPTTTASPRTPTWPAIDAVQEPGLRRHEVRWAADAIEVLKKKTADTQADSPSPTHQAAASQKGLEHRSRADPFRPCCG